MMALFYRLIISLVIVVIHLVPVYGVKQVPLRFDEKVFVTLDASCNRLEGRGLECGSFLFNIQQKDDDFHLATTSGQRGLKSCLEQLNNKLEQRRLSELFLILEGEYEKAKLKTLLNKVFANQVLFADTLTFQQTDSLSNKGKKIVCLLNDRITRLSKDTANAVLPYHGRFLNDPINRMLIFEPNSEELDTLSMACVNKWEETGRVPNFIVVPSDQYTKGQEVASWLNKLRRFRGELRYKGKVLNEIFWKQLPGTVTTGSFSFPILDYSRILSPYKNGFKITPGEIIHHTGMDDIVRPFEAYDTQIEDRLMYHMLFDNRAVNEKEPETNILVSGGVEWCSDDKRGMVVRFKDANSYLDYGKENVLNFNTPISFSAWVKPEKVERFMGIIGIGAAFSFKLMEGRLDFTTAKIKDHIVEPDLKAGEWTHIGFVVNPNATIDFFLNGQMIGGMKVSRLEPSKQSVIIGNNIWGEQFFGCIDELMIWDRGISEKEFAELYEEQVSPKRSNLQWWLLSVLGILGLVFLLLRDRLRKTLEKRSEHPVEEAKPEITELIAVDKEPVVPYRIDIFGSFNVVNAEEGNVTKSYSPLLRELLAFFMLRTVFSENGITSKELSEVFWPGFTKIQAKENRGTNIRRLRNLIEQLPGVQIIYRDKRWFFESTEETQVDLIAFVEFCDKLKAEVKSGHLDLGSLSHFLNIIGKGNILKNIESEWLDAFKSKMSHEVTELLPRVCALEKCPAIYRVECAKAMLLFDNLNEEALAILVHNLMEMGNHGQARQAYDEFAKRYENLYDEPFPVSYNSL
ncbi:hypothetical protein EYV94_04215 [Puteibacter caeruleilacunae]|nr:hypothetical protein EYV94_04215 [Puteibacter caeruleilacunae]